MKKKSSQLSPSDKMKRTSSTQVSDEDEDEDDRKPAARSAHSTDDSQTDAPTDQSLGSYASSSTIPCHPMATASPSGKGGDLSLPLATIEEAQHSHNTTSSGQMQAQLFFLAGTSLLSLLAFISVLIPTSALAALSIFVASTVLLFRQSYRFLVQLYGRVIDGRGIGDYLPGWLFSMLVEDSIHQQMVDPSDSLELRYLALYFIPGLTQAQIDAFVDRLAPRHRNFLLRPGVGHILGDDFMQLILGRERYPAVPESQQGAAVAGPIGQGVNSGNNGNPYPLPPPMTNYRRLNFEDDDSSATSSLAVHVPTRDVGNSAAVFNRARDTNPTTRALVSSQRPNQAQSSQIPREAIISTIPALPENDQVGQDDFDFGLLVEAFASGMIAMVAGPAMNFVSYLADEATGAITRPSVSVFLVGGAMGIFGYWRGIFRQPANSSNRDIVATAVLGGGVAGLLYMTRRAYVNRRKAPFIPKKE